jgi:hypothetical protein
VLWFHDATIVTLKGFTKDKGNDVLFFVSSTARGGIAQITMVDADRARFESPNNRNDMVCFGVSSIVSLYQDMSEWKRHIQVGAVGRLNQA